MRYLSVICLAILFVVMFFGTARKAEARGHGNGRAGRIVSRLVHPFQGRAEARAERPARGKRAAGNCANGACR